MPYLQNNPYEGSRAINYCLLKVQTYELIAAKKNYLINF
jgi:hypothetical protein